MGEAAFAHKAGVHVSAVLKNPRTYEHIPPEWVGNQRRFLVSDVSGRSNLLAKLQELGVDLSKEEARRLLEEVKALEYEGYAFEGAEASFYLLAHRLKGGSLPFSVEGFSVFVHGRGLSTAWAEATVRVRVGESLQHTAAESPFGPVSALDRAFRKAVLQFYPELSEVELTDYKVRVLEPRKGTAAKVRVLVEWSDHKRSWSTVGVSDNVIEASWRALIDALRLELMRITEDDETIEKAVEDYCWGV